MLSEEQSAIQDMARNFATEKLAPHAKQWDEDKHFPVDTCLLYTSPSPRDRTRSRMPSSA